MKWRLLSYMSAYLRTQSSLLFISEDSISTHSTRWSEGPLWPLERGAMDTQKGKVVHQRPLGSWGAKLGPGHAVSETLFVTPSEAASCESFSAEHHVQMWACSLPRGVQANQSLWNANGVSQVHSSSPTHHLHWETEEGSKFFLMVSASKPLHMCKKGHIPGRGKADSVPELPTPSPGSLLFSFLFFLLFNRKQT